jgi:DNA-binding transcriptional MerR regulator
MRKTYSLAELAALVELPERTVRYYIQLGLVDRPEGETRAARYGERQLGQLLGIRKWQQAGLSLERIGELLADASAKGPPPRRRGAGTVEVWSHLVIDEGVELTINPGAAGLTPAQVRRLFREVAAAYATIRNQRKP